MFFLKVCVGEMKMTLPYVAAVVDETGKVATFGSIDDGVVVHAEHVAAADALLLVALLPHVGDHLATKTKKTNRNHQSCSASHD